MSKKSNHVFHVKNNGQFKFSLNDRLHKLMKLPNSLWEHPVASLVLLLICGIGDAALFYQLFHVSLYGSPLVLMLSVVAMLTGFDVAPIYLGISLKRRHQLSELYSNHPDYKKPNKGVDFRRGNINEYILLAAMVVAFIANIFVRISLRDVLFEDYGSYDTDTSNSALVFALFFIALPVITSLVSFAVSYMNSNPLKADALKSSKETSLLEEERTDITSTIKEYDLSSDYHARLEESDIEKYHAALDEIYAIKQYYKDLVRIFIAELSGDPSSTNAVTRDVNPEPIALSKQDNPLHIVRSFTTNEVKEVS